MKNNPIGVLDSGVGGLSVWQEIVALLATESTIYICDQKNIPYGTKTVEEIHVLARKMIAFLLEKQVKLIVIACNTITVSSLDKLRQEFHHIPIIGTVPVIKLAAEISKNKKIGILSTLRTANSDYQKQLIKMFASGYAVINKGTDILVPLIEDGKLDETKHVLPTILESFRGVDTLALGCTHFPFIEQQIRNIIGRDVHLLDSGVAIARRVKRVLEEKDVVGFHDSPEYAFYTTGNAEHFAIIAKKLVKKEVRGKIGLVEGVDL